MNTRQSGLLIVAPLTTTINDVPLRLTIRPPEGGLRRPSQAQIDQVRSISDKRFLEKWGKLSDASIAQAELLIRIAFNLE